MTPPAFGGAPGAKKFPDYVPPTKVHYDGAQAGDAAPAQVQAGHAGRRPRARARLRQGRPSPSARWRTTTSSSATTRCRATTARSCRRTPATCSSTSARPTAPSSTACASARRYLKPGCTIGLGNTELKFHAADEKVEIVPSRKEKLGGMVGRHVKMRELYAILEKIAPTATTVVIEGETGTGKEVVAQTIHELSPRGDGPIMVFDCGAVPDNLIESELFGHEKGSFTGAIMTRQGLFEMAARRHAVPRRARRAAARSAAQAPARARAARDPPRRLEQADQGRRAHHRRDQPQPRGRGARRALPPGSVLSPERGAACCCRRCASASTTSRCSSSTSSPRRRTTASPTAPQKVTGVSRAAMDLLHDLPVAGQRARAGQHHRARGLVRRGRADRAARSAGDGARRRGGAAAPGARAGAAAGRGGRRRRHLQGRQGALGLVASSATTSCTLLKKNKGNISHAAREADIDRKYFRKLMKKYDIEGGSTSKPTTTPTRLGSCGRRGERYPWRGYGPPMMKRCPPLSATRWPRRSIDSGV